MRRELTLGVDLASDPKKTGVCVVEWEDRLARVKELEVGADDDKILDLHRGCDATGIDAPFGWPIAFVDFLCGKQLPSPKSWGPGRRDELRFRLTDFRVREMTGRWPLSVSTDLIGVPALRCAGLLEGMGVADRSGDGRVYEVYPASALRVWGLRSTGYKGPKKRAERKSIWADLERQMPWLGLADAGMASLLLDSDDALDALIAALVTRGAKVALTICPTEEERPRAKSEGWIHVPVENSLGQLV